MYLAVDRNIIIRLNMQFSPTLPVKASTTEQNMLNNVIVNAKEC